MRRILFLGGDELGAEDADEGEVAVALSVVEAVADDELVGDDKANVVGGDRLDAAFGFVEEDADFDFAGLEFAEAGQDAGEGLAGVKDVVDEKNVAARDVQAEFLGENEFAGFGAGAVAGDADEVQAEWEGEAAEKIGEENNGAVEEGDDDEVAPGEVALDFGGERFDAAGKFFLRNEDGGDFGASAAGGFGAGG